MEMRKLISDIRHAAYLAARSAYYNSVQAAIAKREQRIQRFTHVAEKKQGFILRDHNPDAGKTYLCKAFDNVASLIRDNPDLDRDVTLKQRPRENSAVEQEVPVIRAYAIPKAQVLKADGLLVYALRNQWTQTIALRFDRGSADDLLALKGRLESRAAATQPELVA